MNTEDTASPSERHRVARRAVDELGTERDSHVLLRVRCGRSHHVAAVYDTAAGAVYESVVGPHAHGRRDFVDEPHHRATHGTRYIDLLNGGPLTDDQLPASCECGSFHVSRTEVRRAMDEGKHTLQLH
ncbi:hypothetical protein [Nocardia rhizosphaerihabitans]|uniref:Uncharacterized protein n=1 Tax=Nocardia rhizosphaerihabitans TaxID=1691570 RepID=A0ABQ2KXR1_9NOCA|nr:hypothetical protein [Nocardia rhizosphaerihabitans]GGN93805.1 hypothetical protein GCM10011610_56110 [Nocardia rhizosphaerihabitans]